MTTISLPSAINIKGWAVGTAQYGSGNPDNDYFVVRVSAPNRKRGFQLKQQFSSYRQANAVADRIERTGRIQPKYWKVEFYVSRNWHMRGHVD